MHMKLVVLTTLLEDIFDVLLGTSGGEDSELGDGFVEPRA
jgi:hypothetical protein